MKPGICFPVPQSAFVPPYPSPPPLQELSALSRTGSLQRQDALSDETTWLTSEDNEDVDVVYIQVNHDDANKKTKHIEWTNV